MSEIQEITKRLLELIRRSEKLNDLIEQSYQRRMRLIDKLKETTIELKSMRKEMEKSFKP